MRHLLRTAALLLCGLGASSSCFTGSKGRPPNATQLYFPTGLAISAGRSTLYVANSDFDLQYAGGVVQALDAHALRVATRPIVDALAQHQPAEVACAKVGLGINPDPFLNPGPCAPLDAAPFIRQAAFVGAFASAMALAYYPTGGGARLFTPVRGDPSITFFDVDDDRKGPTGTFRLDCSQGDDGFCGDDHRIGRNPDRSLRGLQMPSDPLGTAASPDGTAIVSAHQTQQAASLVINPWQSLPYLSYFVSRLPVGPTEVAAIPRPAVVDRARAAALAGNYNFNYNETFALTYRASPELDIITYQPDSGSVPPRPFLVVQQQVPLTVSASNADSRGVAVVSTARLACEATCATKASPLDCAADCAEQVPLKIYITARAPATLLIGRVHTLLSRSKLTVAGVTADRITAVLHTVDVHESIPLDFGASHVRVGQVVGKDGTLVDRVFALAFDAREIFIIDPLTDTVEAVMKAGRGPQDVAIDSGVEDGQAYSFMYVAHFTDSYLGVADLDLRRPLSYAQLVANVGTPTPPAESR